MRYLTQYAEPIGEGVAWGKSFQEWREAQSIQGQYFYYDTEHGAITDRNYDYSPYEPHAPEIYIDDTGLRMTTTNYEWGNAAPEYRVTKDLGWSYAVPGLRKRYLRLKISNPITSIDSPNVWGAAYYININYRGTAIHQDAIDGERPYVSPGSREKLAQPVNTGRPYTFHAMRNTYRGQNFLIWAATADYPGIDDYSSQLQSGAVVDIDLWRHGIRTEIASISGKLVFLQADVFGLGGSGWARAILSAAPRAPERYCTEPYYVGYSNRALMIVNANTHALVCNAMDDQLDAGFTTDFIKLYNPGDVDPPGYEET